MTRCNLDRIAKKCALQLKIQQPVKVKLMSTRAMKTRWPTVGICHGLAFDPKPPGIPHIIVVNSEFYRKNYSNCSLFRELMFHELLHIKLKSRSHGSKFSSACKKLGIDPMNYSVHYHEIG